MKRARSVEISGSEVGAWGAAIRRDAAAKRIVAAWRRLSSGEGSRRAGPGAGTVIACSGGADSSALVLALAAAVAGGKAGRPRIIVAHIVHDLRPREEAEGDRERASQLAELAGAEFVEARVRVREAGGNMEGEARKARYAALLKLAKREGVGFVATGHHAGDQLETVLMALMRGAGPRGLAGAAIERAMKGRGGRGAAKGVRLVRPMIEAGTTREDSERLCRLAGWAWAVDATNADESRLRSTVRHRLVPVMKEIRPGVEQRAVESARVMRYAAMAVRARGEWLWRQGRVKDCAATWPRAMLRGQSAVLLGELVRMSAELLAGEEGRDKLGVRAIAPVVRAIRDDSTEPRRVELGAIRVDITARAVTIAARRSR